MSVDNNREHLYYIDILRVLSVSAVIAGHVYEEQVYRFYFSVLMFTAISGGLMLSHERIDIKKLYTRNILRIVTAFAFWSTLYSVIEHVLIPLADGGKVQIKLVVTSIIEGHFHLWYCYMIAGLFILAPFIKAALDHDEKTGLYFMVVAFLFSVLIPSLQGFGPLAFTTRITDNIGLDGFEFMMYFVMGYFMMKIKKDERTEKLILIAGCPVVLLFVLFVGTTMRPVSESLFVAWLFLLARFFFRVKNRRAAALLVTLGDAVFGVYLIHEIFDILFDRLFGIPVMEIQYLAKYFFMLIASFACIIPIRRIKSFARFIS